jgi:hypothetical protein
MLSSIDSADTEESLATVTEAVADVVNVLAHGSKASLQSRDEGNPASWLGVCSSLPTCGIWAESER